jgi:hypothetical protein
MGIKIHEYANEAFQINDEDFYDVDYWNGASYESRKISGATLKSELSGGSGGRFGIADTNGVYTYYTTLTAAMTAAISGQTIEVFADYTETSAVTITLKDGVNINGNGHTYRLSVVGVSNAFQIPASTSVTTSILNYNIIRVGSSSIIGEGNCLNVLVNTFCSIDLTGSKLTNLGAGSAICVNSNVTGRIDNATAVSKSGFGAYFIGTSLNIFTLNKCIGYGYSGGVGIRLHSGGTANLCYGYSDSGTGFINNGNANNCVGISETYVGFENYGGFATNCTGRSISSTGFASISDGKNAINCVGISVSGIGMNTSFSIWNCMGVSSSGTGILLNNNAGLAAAHNCTAKSSASYALWGFATSRIYNCIVICEWNNAAGYGIRGNGGISNAIMNTTIKLSNASAPYLYNDNLAQAISMRGNTYEGGAVFNANLTQAIVSVEDNQGNLFI